MNVCGGYNEACSLLELINPPLPEPYFVHSSSRPLSRLFEPGSIAIVSIESKNRDKDLPHKVIEVEYEYEPLANQQPPSGTIAVSSGESRLHRQMPEEVRNTDTER